MFLDKSLHKQIPLIRYWLHHFADAHCDNRLWGSLLSLNVKLPLEVPLPGVLPRGVWGEMPEKPLTFCLRGWVRVVQGSETGSLHCLHLTVMFLQSTGAFSPRSGLTSIQKKPPDFSACLGGLRIILLILRPCWDSETSVHCSPRISPARGLHLVPGCLATS